MKIQEASKMQKTSKTQEVQIQGFTDGIKESFDKALEFWRSENMKFFGLPLKDENSADDYQSLELDRVCAEIWNKEGDIFPEVKRYCLNLTDKIIKYNPEDPKSGFTLIEFPNYIKIAAWVDVDGEAVEVPFMFTPIPTTGLTWRINKTQYIPRGTIKRNMTSLTKVDNIVRHERFAYNCNTGVFKFFEKPVIDEIGNVVFNEEGKWVMDTQEKPFAEYVTDKNSLLFLKAFAKGEFKNTMSDEEFGELLKTIPTFEYNDVVNYNYFDFRYFLDDIRKMMNEKKTFDPHKRVISNAIMCNSKMIELGRKNNGDVGLIREDSPDCMLILDGNKIFELSTFRSGVFSSENNRAFFFKNTELFFDAYKTPTSKSAGKCRNYLDDVFIDGGILYKEVNGKVLDMYEVYKRFFIDGDKSVKTKSLSSLSLTPFCNYNFPKRIMMTSKALSQSIQVDGETNPITHEIPLRVVFGNLDGFNINEGIVISESAAEKLKNRNTETIFVSKTDKTAIQSLKDCFGNDIKITNPVRISTEFYKELNGYSKNDFLRYQNIEIISIKKMVNQSKSKKMLNGYKIVVSYEVPMLEGDKLTNFHGSKGIVSKIIPDDQMPKLTKDIGNFKKGPFEIVLSAHSVTERGSIGQLIECVNSVYGIDKFEDLTDDQISSYDEKIIEYKGEMSNHYFGMQKFVRFYHLTVSHASFSSVESENKNLLNLGQQEKIFLNSQDFEYLLKELKVRGNKVKGRKSGENSLIVNKYCDNGELSLSTFDLMNSLLNYEVDLGNNWFKIIKTEIDDRDVELEITGDSKLLTRKHNGVKYISQGYGIYDHKKFKKKYSCECGRQKKKGAICNYCGTSADHKVRHYIRLNQNYPSIITEYSVFGKHKENIKNLSEFKAIMYLEDSGWELKKYNRRAFKELDPNKEMHYGQDGVKKYCELEGLTEIYDMWIKDAGISNKFIIQPLENRMPIIDKTNKLIKKKINDCYEKFIKHNNKVKSMESLLKDDDKIKHFMLFNKTYQLKEKSDNFIFDTIKKGKNSLINKEGVAQKISAAVRGVISLDTSLPEDVLNIGLGFADYLYPEFTSLWSTPEELNYLISRGVLQVPEWMYEVPDSFLENVLPEEFEKAKESDIAYEAIKYFYPWRMNSYIKRFYKSDVNKFVEDFKFFMIEQKMNLWKFYITHESNIPYAILLNRPPTISQLSFYALYPCFGRRYTQEDLDKVEIEMSKIIYKWEEDSVVEETGYGYTFLMENVDYSTDISQGYRFSPENHNFINKVETIDVPTITNSRSTMVWTDSRYLKTGVVIEPYEELPGFAMDNKEIMIYDKADFKQNSEVREMIFRTNNNRNINIDNLIFNPIICDGMNADFDSDVCLLLPVFSLMANIEISNMVCSKNYITCSDGLVRNEAPDDIKYIFYKDGKKEFL